MLFFLLLFNVEAFAQESRMQSLTILYTANTNGYLEECPCSKDGLGGIARRKTVFEQHQSGKTLVLDAGNLCSPYRKNEAQEKLLMTLIEKLSYSLMNLGEQEFSYGLNFWKENGHKLNFVSANLRDKEGNRLTPPFQVFAFESLRVAVTGVLSESAFQNLPEDLRAELSLVPIEEELSKTLVHIKNEQPNLIVLLLRSQDYEAEQSLAKRFPELHLIISTDERLAREKPLRIGQTLAMSAGSEGEKVGKLSLVVDTKKNQILSYENVLISLSKRVRKNAQIDSLIQSFKQSQLK
jgi:2',3'-cyclic-nucleotide 2'-phosphodiesterase (5'-nucleotidase family)